MASTSRYQLPEVQDETSTLDNQTNTVQGKEGKPYPADRVVPLAKFIDPVPVVIYDNIAEKGQQEVKVTQNVNFASSLGTQVLISPRVEGTHKLFIANSSAATVVWLGTATVTDATGFPLLPNSTIEIDNDTAWYGYVTALGGSDTKCVVGYLRVHHVDVTG